MMWYDRAQELEAENGRLRAELAAERERAEKNAKAFSALAEAVENDTDSEYFESEYLDVVTATARLTAERDALRAELAAERERVLDLQHDVEDARHGWNTARADLAAANALRLKGECLDRADRVVDLARDLEFARASIAALRAELAAERDRVTKLREALEPFASQCGAPVTIISPEMLRHARAVLEETE